LTDLEARLEAALRAPAAPARDPAFRVETLLRHEKALFRRKLMICCAVALAAVLAAALCGLSGAHTLQALVAAAVAGAAGFLAARHTRAPLPRLWR
jgi:hypothetical protein